MNKLKELSKRISPDISIIFILFIFIIAGLFHYIFYHTQIEMYESTFNDAKYEYNENVWRIIDDSITETNNKAKDKGLELSQRLVNTIEKKNDKGKIKNQLDSGNYVESGIFVDIFNIINNEYLLNIKSEDNGVFVLYKDLYIDNKVHGNGFIHTSIKEFIDSEYNPIITSQAINKLIYGKGYNLIFLEDRSYNPNFEKMKVMNKESLKEIVQSEGIDCLKYYTILIPIYITEDGDIFGTLDISYDGSASNNHKMILVQKYNLYDAVVTLHRSDLSDVVAEHDKVVLDINHLLTFTHVTYLAVMLMDMMFILLVLVYLSKLKKKE